MSAPARAQLEELGISATCVDVLRHLWDYLDDQITPDGAARLKAHIAACEECRGFEDNQECFLAGLAQLKAQIGAPDSVREKLAEKLRGQGCACWEKVRVRS
jgi:anti-sigma factor (TIGR02949 family)